MELLTDFIGLTYWSLAIVAPLLLFLCFIIVCLGQIVCHIEKWEKFDGLYWSFITATTVGYGDIRPVKKVSKVLSLIIALSGLIFTGIIIAVALNSTSVVIEKHGNTEIIELMKKKF